MGKDLKIKYSASSPPTKNFFHKKTLHGRTNVFGQIWEGGGMFYMGTNDQIIQEGELMVNRFQRSSQVSFSSH